MQPCLVDAHVHLYPEFDPGRILSAATENFGRFAPAFGLSPGTPSFLLLSQLRTEPSPARVFDLAPDGWTAEKVDGIGTFRLRGEGRPDLYIVPGWQVVTAEGLEVLALCTAECPAAGNPIVETLHAVQAAAGIAVVPWGNGKWSGQRGAVVRRLIADPAFDFMFLGDNAGRLGLLPRPVTLADGEAAGLKVLPGTDPLPFRGEEQKIGRMCFQAAFDAASPADSLKGWLQKAASSPTAAGEAEGLLRFLKLQTALQLRKRLG